MKGLDVATKEKIEVQGTLSGAFYNRTIRLIEEFAV
jgi:hypothetical protein